MTQGYYYPPDDDWGFDDSYDYELESAHRRLVPIDLPLLMIVLAIIGILSLATSGLRILPSSPMVVLESSPIVEEREAPIQVQPAAPPISDPSAFIAPYDAYILTQGVHGQSYGHMAIDIAAGKGVPIKSPISGRVSELYVDAIGNPTLVIENDRYRITLLHGIYEVQPDTQINIGDRIGVEGNLGNTRDMQGNSCRNRDCGYHSHLNVFDKQAGTNINPLDLLGI